MQRPLFPTTISNPLSGILIDRNKYLTVVLKHHTEITPTMENEIKEVTNG